MSSDLALLQLSSALVGGGAVPLVIAIIRRRAELREIDARADSASADATTKLAGITERFTHRLADEVERQTVRAAALEARIDEIRAASEAETARLTEYLRACEAEGLRLSREVARLTVDLDTTRRQLAALKRQKPPGGQR